MHQLYIFSNFRDIYLITENNCSEEGTDCSNMGAYVTKHKLYDQIGAKSSNYYKNDIFSQSENVSVYL